MINKNRKAIWIAVGAVMAISFQTLSRGSDICLIDKRIQESIVDSDGSIDASVYNDYIDSIISLRSEKQYLECFDIGVFMNIVFESQFDTPHLARNDDFRKIVVKLHREFGATFLADFVSWTRQSDNEFYFIYLDGPFEEDPCAVIHELRKREADYDYLIGNMAHGWLFKYYEYYNITYSLHKLSLNEYVFEFYNDIALDTCRAEFEAIVSEIERYAESNEHYRKFSRNRYEIFGDPWSFEFPDELGWIINKVSVVFEREMNFSRRYISRGIVPSTIIVDGKSAQATAFIQRGNINIFAGTPENLRPDILHIKVYLTEADSGMQSLIYFGNIYDLFAFFDGSVKEDFDEARKAYMYDVEDRTMMSVGRMIRSK